MRAWRAATLALCAVPLLAAHHEAKKTHGEVPEAAEYLRVYTGDDGESHFERVSLPLAGDPSAAQPLSRSTAFQGSEVTFIGAPTNWDYTWHVAPRRQFVIVVRGAMEVEVSGGRVETFRPGDVLLADDTTGRGHITRSVGEDPLLLAVVPVE